MNLSEHFTLEELVASQLAARQRIDNRPTAVVIDNLRRVAGVLEQVRTLVGKPVMVSSGYRCPALNKAVGGAPASAHLDGLAADITVPGMTARELAAAIRDSSIVLDQLIYEGTWVHVGLANGKPRRQVLTARFGQGGTTYSQGIV
jgi:zinc D-Ala-D-Ala carboxypeptidase